MSSFEQIQFQPIFDSYQCDQIWHQSFHFLFQYTIGRRDELELYATIDNIYKEKDERNISLYFTITITLLLI